MSGSPLSAPRELRARWYLQVDKYHKTVDEVCSIFGMSRKTYYKWKAKDFGPSDHTYKQRKPHPNTKLTPRVKVFIHEAKLKYNYGPQKMKVYVWNEVKVEVSSTVLYRYFKKKRLIKKPQVKQTWYHPMKQRFTSHYPGENVQLDTKYVPGVDQRWEYQFRFIDTYSNLQFAVNCFDKSALSAIYAFRRAQRNFPFEIIGIQTDNGGEFRGVFAELLEELDIQHRFIPKRSAPWNGKVERANRSVDDEYYLNMERPWKTLEQYVHWYNHKRPHLGHNMNGLTPQQKFLNYQTDAKKCHP